MLDHMGLPVSDFEASRNFYAAALAALGMEVVFEGRLGTGTAAFGKDGRPSFGIRAGDAPNRPLHVAFAAADHAEVDAFHAAAVAAGGTDNGPPGPRPEYHDRYYGAFVLDPDGHNIEAVCHT